MIRLALALALLAAPAAAAPVTPWVPGGSPCDGACSLEWARAQAGAPAGDPVPQTVYPGQILEGMSYARAGAPVWDGRTHVVAAEEPLTGVGYEFERGGRRWLMFRADACLNWTVALIGAVHATPEAPAPAYGVAARPASFAHGGGVGGGFFGRGGGGSLGGTIGALIPPALAFTPDRPLGEVIGENAPPFLEFGPTAAVPVPPSLLLLLSAIAGFFLLGRGR